MRVPRQSGYVCAIAAVVFTTAATIGSPPTRPAAGKTIGLVLTTEMPGNWETPGAQEECPDGLQFNDKDNWSALPKEVQEERTNKFGHRWNRGPNGESSTAVPWAVDDRLPLKESQSKTAYGFNLDGTQDGGETANTCGHQKFRSPDGKVAVDNQLYRVMACTKGWRVGGAATEYRMMEFPTYSQNRILFEVSGVDSEVNDDHVDITIYKGLDTLLKDSKSEFLPNMTQRVDPRVPVIAKTTGHIADGVLTIDPVEHVRFTMRWNVRTGTRDWYNFHVQLKLAGDTAEGIIGGYQDIEAYWLMYRRGFAVSTDNSGWSLPSLYQGTVRLADGHRDPATGKCSAISSVLRVKAVRTMIVHPEIVERPGEYDLKGY